MTAHKLSISVYNESIKVCKKYLKGFKQVPFEEVVGTDSKLDECDIFLWCDELHVVDDSGYGTSGTVRYLDGGMASNNFYWKFQDEVSYKIGSISKNELQKLIREYHRNK